MLSIRRKYRVSNAWIRELYGVKRCLDGRVLRWFGYVERDTITNGVYVGECAGILSMGRPRKRWIDTVKECLKKRGLDVRQARKMVQDRGEWWGFVRG